MGNIKTYLEAKGNVLFSKNHFNEVDNLIFSELVYVDFNNICINKKIRLQKAIDCYLNQENNINKITLLEDPMDFLKYLKNTNRFKNLKLFNYVNNLSKDKEEQFSAISIRINRNTIFVAFKGTDDTLLGWKEDFNLSYLSATPSQLDAVNYVNKIKRKYKNIIIGGHSKGGNLAVYAALNCQNKIKKRIKKVFNNDGPGFLEEINLMEGNQSILNKIVNIVPESSIIGMLLTHVGEYKIIKSINNGIWQHEPLSWQVEDDHFETIETIDDFSKKMNKTLSEWLKKIDKEQRKIFVNTLFEFLDKNNIKTIMDLSNLKLKDIPHLVKVFHSMDSYNKEILVNLIKELIMEAKKNLDAKTILETISQIKKTHTVK